MFQSWRFKLREAEEALKGGRLDEAFERIQQGRLVEFLPGKRVAGKLATHFARRARQRAAEGDQAAAWKDARAAQSLTGETGDVLALRRNLAAAGRQDIERLLETGDSATALAAIEALEKHVAGGTELVTLRHVTQRLHSANHLARRGRFAEAETQLAAALKLRPNLKILRQRLTEMQRCGKETRPLSERLHRAMADASWSCVVSLADQVLAIAPECRWAQDARRMAWARAGHPRAERLDRTQAWSRTETAMAPAVMDGCHRFVLWVDGVGGYLLCTADEVVLGQSTPRNFVDVPIQADLSRKHAQIRRSGEGYTLEPWQTVAVNSRRIHSPVLLSDGDELELGNGVRLRFRRPHALSATARLDFLSRHRTHPSVDGILLMAESCVLGPKWQNHVVCRDWSDDVVMYRQDDAFYCRAMAPIEIDGQWCDGRGPLAANSHIAGSDFSMSLEELDRCSTQPLL